jgi:hypothetical protein
VGHCLPSTCFHPNQGGSPLFAWVFPAKPLVFSGRT